MAGRGGDTSGPCQRLSGFSISQVRAKSNVIRTSASLNATLQLHGTVTIMFMTIRDARRTAPRTVVDPFNGWTLTN